MTAITLTTLLLALGTGTSLTFISSHWLLAWMGLEISTLAILPLMAQHYHPRATEAATKYFLIQATAAAVLLFASITNAWISGHWDIQQTSHPLPLTLATLALALKIGLAPLHSWQPEVLQGLNLTTGMIMATWQKLAPFAILLQIQTPNSSLLIALGILSIFVGGWGGLNQTQLRKVLGYSSIAHLGWMVLVLQYSQPLALLALLLYIIVTYATFTLFNIKNATSVKALFALGAKNPILTTLLPFLLLSLASLPPLTGFLAKLLILKELTKQGLAPTAALAIMGTLLSAFFYVRLSVATALTLAPNITTATGPWRLHNSPYTIAISIATVLAILLFPSTPSALTPFTH
uniref:NADH-ubiquinone oxidoreductase chain 2 n=2 Tax=Centropyge TaxID=109718 RepID=A0A0U2KCA3_CENFL|nr:NADH dehydrogenase subunit 2 [Centropyge flavicauda]YP_009192237.1 NADH dehydrogenase subunit 2 [Centropyge acanthops]ALP13746.1 NADH dehydrogenase subunit 2 [Centropyge flavicauda]ALP13759.1 NADH dehydrogenase subunit 2 [Centropyge acanthops]WNH20114.1 NADH dehydrogenase subunit 2 [Centropyge fisheri]